MVALGTPKQRHVQSHPLVLHFHIAMGQHQTQDMREPFIPKNHSLLPTGSLCQSQAPLPRAAAAGGAGTQHSHGPDHTQIQVFNEFLIKIPLNKAQGKLQARDKSMLCSWEQWEVKTLLTCINNFPENKNPSGVLHLLGE